MKRSEQALLIQPPRPDDFELFSHLPVVPRFLRIEKGAASGVLGVPPCWDPPRRLD